MGLGSNSINRKRKKTDPPAADVVLEKERTMDDREEEDGTFLRLYSKIPASKIVEKLSGLVSKDDSVLTPEELTCTLYLYGMLLRRLVFMGVPIATDSDSRGKIRHKIWNQYLDFVDKEDHCVEELLYTLRAYAIFLEWLNAIELLTDCRGRVIEQMLDLLRDEDSKEPEQLVCKLRPYARFLEWLEEETSRPEDYSWMSCHEPHKACGRKIATMLRFLSDDKVVKCTAQRVLNIVDINLKLLKSTYEHIEGATKKQEPAEKTRTSTLNPIMDSLSGDDSKLLKRFRRKFWGIAAKVLDEFREYQKQVKESGGFDFYTYPGCFGHKTPVHPIGLYASRLKNIDFKKLAELAINKYAKGKIKFQEVVRVNRREYWRTNDYFITFTGHYRGSLHHFRALVTGTLNNFTHEEEYKVWSVRPKPTELGPSGSASDNDLTKKLQQTILSLDTENNSNLNKNHEARVEELVKDNHKSKRVTRASANYIAQILESELKVDKPKAGRVARRSSKFTTQVSESMGTKEKVSYDPEGEYSNHNTCEKHRKELSRYKSFIDMPDDELLKTFREADRSTAAPLIKELRQYFERVLKSEGFNIGQYPGLFSGVSIIKPLNSSPWSFNSIEVEKLAELAIRSYNDDNGSQFELESITEVNVSEAMHFHYYITFLARTEDAVVAETFRALVSVNMLLLESYEVHFCRLVQKPN